jgi:predicted nucleotidyltransferase
VDVFDKEILSFWKALQENSVQYIMVGGYAINLHGFQRFTSDLDIWLNDTPDNRKALRNALADCAMGDYPPIENMQFLPGWAEFILNNGLRLDVLTNMKGLEQYTFEECLQMASVADIEGVSVPFMHIDQLIQNKKVVNRPKDQIDINALEEIKKLREDS